MVVTYITKEENTTFIIILMLLNRAAFNLNIHFNKYETDSYVCQLFGKSDPCIVSIADISK